MRRLGARAGRAARARGRAGARPRPAALRARGDRGGGARPRRGGASWRPSASGCATPRACARRPPARWRRSPAPTRTAAAPAARWARPRPALARGRRGRRRARRARRAARALPRSSSRTSAGELRAYLEGIEAEPGRLEEVEERLDALDRLKRKHGGTIEAVLAHAERCRAEIERLEDAERARPSELGGRAGGGRARGAPSSPASSSEARAKAAAQLAKRVAAELDRAGDGGRDARGRRSSRTPTASARTARRRSSCGSRTNPGMPSRRRCATPPRAASSRG